MFWNPVDRWCQFYESALPDDSLSDGICVILSEVIWMKDGVVHFRWSNMERCEFDFDFLIYNILEADRPLQNFLSFSYRAAQ